MTEKVGSISVTISRTAYEKLVTENYEMKQELTRLKLCLDLITQLQKPSIESVMEQQ